MSKESKYESYTKPSFVKKYGIEILIVFIGLVVIHAIFLSDAFKGDEIDPQKASYFGDFVGGYIGSLFTLLSIILLYITIKEQRKTSAIEKFESKYFELIRMHRENASEFKLGESSGKKIFVLMIRELRLILSRVTKMSNKHNLQLSKKELLILSYRCLLYGVGPNSNTMLKKNLKEYPNEFVDELIDLFYSKKERKKAIEERKLKFNPFGGHQSRLGHYYRHLYQTVRYVDNQKIDIDKYEYVKTIRAQLTTHEQALLFVNSLTLTGKNWWTYDLIVKYRFVQNIPDGFFNDETEIVITDEFDKDYFEHQEINTDNHN